MLIPVVQYINPWSGATRKTVSNKNYRAERFFRAIKKHDLEKDRVHLLRVFKQRWPGYVPEPFRTTGNHRTRRAYELFRGQKMQGVFAPCGSMGRLRVLAGKPLQRSIISFNELPSVRKLRKDPDAQFSQQAMDWVKEDLCSIIRGPFIAFAERGKDRGNHVHVFCRQGCCWKGSRKVVPDNELLKAIEYVVKKPYWTDENALAYLGSANLNERVGRRIIKHGLGDSRTKPITVYEVERILGIELLKAKIDKPTKFYNFEDMSQTHIRYPS